MYDSPTERNSLYTSVHSTNFLFSRTKSSSKSTKPYVWWPQCTIYFRNPKWKQKLSDTPSCIPYKHSIERRRPTFYVNPLSTGARVLFCCFLFCLVHTTQSKINHKVPDELLKRINDKDPYLQLKGQIYTHRHNQILVWQPSSPQRERENSTSAISSTTSTSSQTGTTHFYRHTLRCTFSCL